MSAGRILVVAAALSVACGDAPSEAPTFADVQSGALGQSCAFSSCHGASAGTGGLHLDGTDADYDRLVDVASSAGASYVVPGDADGSYLVQKLEDAAGITGEAMPPGAPLDADKLQLVRDWIDGGALR